MQADDEHGYYNQGTEVQLLIDMLGRLENKHVIDVGAETGSVVRALLGAGADAVYAFEPYPASVEMLQKQFGDLPSVRIIDVAVGARDEGTKLYVVEDKTQHIAEAYHSLVRFEETPTLRIVGELPVQCRTLDSLVAEGVLPSAVGILKVDTERSDLAVLQGMGRLVGDVVMIEYWDNLPETVGPAPYRAADVVQLMAGRSYSNFIIVKRHDQFETLLLNDARTATGDWGNLIFVHDSVFPALSALTFRAVAEAQNRLLERAQFFAGEAQKRLVLIEQEEIAAERSVDEVAALTSALEEKERIIADLTATAAERLALVEHADAVATELRLEHERMTADLEAKQQIITDLIATAAERLEIIEQAASADPTTVPSTTGWPPS